MSGGPLARMLMSTLQDSLDQGTWLAIHKNTFTVTVNDTRGVNERIDDERAGVHFDWKMEIPVSSGFHRFIDGAAHNPVVWRMTQLGRRHSIEFEAKGMSLRNVAPIRMEVVDGHFLDGQTAALVSIWTKPVGGEMLFAVQLDNATSLQRGDVWLLEAGAIEYRLHVD